MGGVLCQQSLPTWLGSCGGPRDLKRVSVSHIWKAQTREHKGQGWGGSVGLHLRKGIGGFQVLRHLAVLQAQRSVEAGWLVSGFLAGASWGRRQLTD